MYRVSLVARLLVRPCTGGSGLAGCQGCQERRLFTFSKPLPISCFSSTYYSTSSPDRSPPLSKSTEDSAGTCINATKAGASGAGTSGAGASRAGASGAGTSGAGASGAGASGAGASGVSGVGVRGVPVLDIELPYTGNTYISVARALDLYPQLTQAEFEGVPRYQKKQGAANWFLKDELEKKAIAKGTLKAVEEKWVEWLKRRWKRFVTSKEKKALIFSQSTLSTSFQMDRSQWLILFAIAVNLLNSVFKFFAYSVTNSHAIWAEMIHSIADTLNQVILLLGVRYSLRIADSEHPYGWYNMRNIASLLSGFGIFFFGAGLSFYDGIHALMHPQLMDSENISWALMVLLGSLISEGGTLYCAARAMNQSARQNGVSLLEHVRSGQDPSTSVIVQEDAAAVLGVLICGPCVLLSHYLHSPIPDAIGSLCVGGLLAAVACSIIRSNTHILLGRSAPEIKRRQYMQFLEEDPVIRYVYDVKATYIKGGKLRYKAEISLDGEQVVARYVRKLGSSDMVRVKEEMAKVRSVEEAEELLMKHGENITDMVGEEVDRIEQKTKHMFPEIRHLDLEVD